MDLGGVLRLQGDVAAARAHVEMAYNIYRATLGPDHPDTLRAMSYLNLLHRFPRPS